MRIYEKIRFFKKNNKFKVNYGKQKKKKGGVNIFWFTKIYIYEELF